MSMKRIPRITITLLALVYLLGGCALMGGTQQNTRNYVLNSLYTEETRGQPVAVFQDVGILVGPVRLASYLDRSDIVIRDSQNHILLADFSQWAGPLQENFSRVLAENLSVLLSTDRVAIFPGARAMLFDYNVTVDVNRFDGLPGDKADLRARWTILDSNRKKILYEKNTVLSQHIDNDGIEALIAAESRMLADLSREIAGAIEALAKERVPAKK